MAYIAHRCIACSHLESGHEQHQGGKPRRCLQTYRCRCSVYEPGPPVLVPTYGLKGRTLDTITPPGEPVTAGITACDCDDCRALHAEHTTTREDT